VSFTHGEMSSGTSVVEYESHIFGLAFVIIGVVDGCRDTESSVRSVLNERWPWVRVTRGVVDDVLIRTGYYDWGRG
jgi:hypothetical protein